MTTDSSGQQAESAPSPLQDQVDEVQPSGRETAQTARGRSGQSRNPVDAPGEGIAENAASETAPAQDQQQVPRQAAGADEGDPIAPARYEQDTGTPGGYQQAPTAPRGYQQDAGTGRGPASAATQEPPAVTQTAQPAPGLRSGAGDFASEGAPGVDGAQHSLIGDPSDYTRRWEAIQVGFVDSPRSAVQEAETLVSDVMREVASVFQQERQELEQQWSGGNEVSTDDLRVAFQRYRDFFQHLLQV